MIDVTQQIGAVRRAVRSSTRDGQPTKVVVAAQTYPSPVDDVWAALTDPDRLARWFLPVTGDLRVGGRYRLEGNAEGQVLACDPPRRLEVTWEFGGQLTWVDVELAPEGDGTHLRLCHAAPVDTQRWEQYGPGAVGVGWDLSLMGLHLHLTTGEPVPTEEFQAWSTSPEGTEFATRASGSWAEAAVAGGEDPDQAHAAADRTTAFYTGAPVPE